MGAKVAYPRKELGVTSAILGRHGGGGGAGRRLWYPLDRAARRPNRFDGSSRDAALINSAVASNLDVHSGLPTPHCRAPLSDVRGRVEGRVRGIRNGGARAILAGSPMRHDDARPAKRPCRFWFCVSCCFSSEAGKGAAAAEGGVANGALASHVSPFRDRWALSL